MADGGAIPLKSPFTDMSEFFDDAEYGDIHFTFPIDMEKSEEPKEDQETRVISGHLFILGRRCPKLVKLAAQEFNEKNEFEVKGHTYPVFKAFLRYLYSGRVECEFFSVNELIELYELSSSYEEELTSLIDKYMVENIREKCLAALKAKVTKLNLDELMLAYDQAGAHEELRTEVSKPMSRHLNEKTCIRIAMFADEHELDSLMTAAARFIKVNGKKILPQLKDNEKASKFYYKLLVTLLEEP